MVVERRGLLMKELRAGPVFLVLPPSADPAEEARP